MKRFFAVSVWISVLFLAIGCSEDSETQGPVINDDYIVAEIVSPSDGARFSQDMGITFYGEARYFQSSSRVPDSQLVWISDIDGELSSGRALTDNLLSVGTHEIKFEAFDNDGNISGDSISVVVYLDSVLVSIPSAADFDMGWSDGVGTTQLDYEPIHSVALDAFELGRYEVTYSLWSKVKSWGELNGYTFENEGIRGSNSTLSTTIQHPVTNISWRDCIAWCNAYSEKEGLDPVYYTSSGKTEYYKDSSSDGDINNDCVDWAGNGFRLPTEAEWEYVARYIDGSSYVDGDMHSGYNINANLSDCAWFQDNSEYLTHGVGELAANSLGINDMSGNIFEWCWDYYDSDYYPIDPIDPIDNPRGPDSGVYRVLRGGSWIDSSEKCATSVRSNFSPGIDSNNIGFRVCR
ncbi:MAG: formylglycine-generating enzyme family protein [Candidatus Krumholzibacteriota bacterium]|nr:formylglycine-generating enzyme family protein [Candidatus Krumholzibacteriota bacterium]